MDNPILPDFVPASVCALDALINRRIVEARTDAAVDRWLTTKGQIKRRLAALPEAVLDREAVDALQRLEQLEPSTVPSDRSRAFHAS